jgi:hypothetical protein
MSPLLTDAVVASLMPIAGVAVYWIAFFLILGASFIPELVWKKYA